MPAKPTPVKIRNTSAVQKPSATKAKASMVAPVKALEARNTLRASTRSVKPTSTGTETVYPRKKMPVSQPAWVLLSCHSSMNVGSSAGNVEKPSKPTACERHMMTIKPVPDMARAIRVDHA